MMQAMSELAIYEGMLLAKKMGLPLQMFARAASAGCAQTWRLDELVDNVFNHGEKKHRLRLRPGRTGNALKMAEATWAQAGRNRSGASSVFPSRLGDRDRF